MGIITCRSTCGTRYFYNLISITYGKAGLKQACANGKNSIYNCITMFPAMTGLAKQVQLLGL